MLRGDEDVEDEPMKRTCCGRRAKEKEEEVRAVRRASLAGRRMTLRVPDAQQPYEASREERRRVSARLSMAYRGEADFFVGGEDAREAPAGGTPSPQDGDGFFPPADTTPPAAADERDAARSALRRLQEMDSGTSDLATQPTDEPDVFVKPRARRVELVPTRPAGAPMPPPPPPPGPPPPGPPPDTTTL